MKKHPFFCMIVFVFLTMIAFNSAAQDEPANLVGFIATDAPINVRNRPNGTIISSLPPNMSVSILDKSKDGTWLSVELPDGSAGWVSASLVRVMESAVPADLVAITPENAACLEQITELASTLATGIDMSPDGRLLVSNSWNTSVEVYDVRTKIRVITLTPDSDIATSAIFSPDGSELASASNGTVKIWNTQTWNKRIELLGHSDGIVGLAYSPDGKQLASVGKDGLLIVWDVQTGEKVHVIEVHTTLPDDIAFSPDGTVIATAGDWTSSVLRVWDATSGEQLWSKSPGGNLHIAFTPDSSTLIVLGAGPNIYINGFDAQSGSVTLVISAPGGSGSSVAVNPSGTLIAAGGWITGTLILADMATQKVLFTDSSQKGSPSGSVGVLFSRDGRLLVTTDGDKAIRLWGVHDGECTKSG